MEPRGSDAPDRVDAMGSRGYPWARLLSIPQSRDGFRFIRPDQFNAAIEESPVPSEGGTNASCDVFHQAVSLCEGTNASFSMLEGLAEHS